MDGQIVLFNDVLRTDGARKLDPIIVIGKRLMYRHLVTSSPPLEPMAAPVSHRVLKPIEYINDFAVDNVIA